MGQLLASANPMCRRDQPEQSAQAAQSVIEAVERHAVGRTLNMPS
jgi:hypothetical protein